jgi:hypothetical protein
MGVGVKDVRCSVDRFGCARSAANGYECMSGYRLFKQMGINKQLQANLFTPKTSMCVRACPYDWAKVCAHSRSVQININRCGNTQLCGVYTSGDRVDNKLFTHRIMKGRLTCRNQTSSRKRTTGVWTDTFTARARCTIRAQRCVHTSFVPFITAARARARTGAIYGCGLNQ